MTRALLLLAALACTAGAPSATDRPVNAAADDLPAGLVGSPGDLAPAPEFTVSNQKGEQRTREWLQGHPTVVWFFPFAGTPG